MSNFFNAVPSLLCISGAIYLLSTEGGSSQGWGWLLFCGFLMIPSGKSFINVNKNDNDYGDNK